MPLQNDQLNRMIINGYKSIKTGDITFGNINVLIGSNGAGKSNFISAFSFLQDVLAKNLQVSVARSGVSALLYNGRKVTREISFEIFFGQNSYGFCLVPTDDGRLIFQEEYFKHPENPNEGIMIGRGHSESLWDSDNISSSWPEVTSVLSRQNWRVYHFHDTGRSARVKQEHNISNNRVLQYDAGNLAAFLYRIKRFWRANYDEIVRTIQLIAPFFSDFVLEPKDGNDEQIVLRWQQKGCEDVFNASQLSDGTLRFICLAVLLLQPCELQPATIIIDEPELGLHPYAITIFAEMVRQISDKKQIIISTQSVELLDEFNAEDVIVADRNSDGSKFRRLQEEELRLWLDEDYALGELWKKNILGGRLSG